MRRVPAQAARFLARAWTILTQAARFPAGAAIIPACLRPSCRWQRVGRGPAGWPLARVGVRLAPGQSVWGIPRSAYRNPRPTCGVPQSWWGRAPKLWGAAAGGRTGALGAAAALERLHMANDYVPRPDGAFAAFVDNFWAKLYTWWELNSLNVDDLTDLGKAVDEWHASYPAHIAAQAAAEAASTAKDHARARLIALLRPTTQFVQTYPKTTNADRADMGITVREASLTPAQTPRTRPIARVTTGQRLTHTLRFSDEATPQLKRKPKGTMGAEVWLALTGPNTAPPPPGEAYKFVSVSGKGALLSAFTSADAGKTAHYCLRWASTRGEKGPWSEVISATVAA